MAPGTGTEPGRWHEEPPARGPHCAGPGVPGGVPGAEGADTRGPVLVGVPSLLQMQFPWKTSFLAEGCVTGPPMSWAASVYCTDHTDPPCDPGWH